MPINAFLVQGNMIKHKTLPFYETCILNYDIRRRTNPAKVKEFMFEQGTIRPVMHAGNLWDKIKNGFKKLKNGVTKTMDFVDNNEVLKGFKDSALNYLGQKTGVDVNKIYDTTHQIMDALPTYNTDPDPVDYFNQRQEYYSRADPMGKNNPSSTYNQYGQYGNTAYDTYGNAYNSNTYGNQNYSNQWPYNTPVGQQYLNSQPTTSNQNYSYQNQSNPSSFQNQMNNTYNQIQKQPLSAPQQQTVKKNFDLFASGLKSCGSDVITALNRNKTLLKNIPKMLMMGVNASTGKISIHKDFKPILEKFGHNSLIVPKTLKDLVSKLNIKLPTFNPSSQIASIKAIAAPARTINSKPGSGRLNLGRGDVELAGSNDLRVNTSKSSNQLGSTNNNAPTKIKPSSAPATGKSGSRSDPKGKVSRYADILAKLASRPTK